LSCEFKLIMEDLDELIQFENESSFVDFKKNIYQKNQFHELILDVLAFANSHQKGDKFIVCGVKLNSDGSREMVGIQKDNIKDQSSYQQLIQSNIEPDIDVEIISHVYQELTFVIFKIINPQNRPYILKKNYDKLKKGMSLIRKGTFKMPLIRSDFERIYAERNDAIQFKGKITVWYTNRKEEKNGVFVASTPKNLPSDKAREKLKSIIARKEHQLKNHRGPRIEVSHLYKSVALMGGSLPYEDRDIETLKQNLKDVRETYYEDDMFLLCDKFAQDFNISILNTGLEYLKDCTVEVLFPKTKGILIFDQLYSKPKENTFPERLDISSQVNTDNWMYPRYQEHKSHYSYREELGNLKHNLEKKVFTVPLRILFFGRDEESGCLVKIKIHGENLSNPLVHEIEVKIQDPN